MRFLQVILLFITISAGAKDIKLYNNIRIQNNTKSTAITYAQKALLQDFERKFGTTPSKEPPIDIVLNIDENWNEFDKFKIEITTRKITFTGSDNLGLLHGIYSFSEDYLGIDPFVYFTDIVPKWSYNS